MWGSYLGGDAVDQASTGTLDPAGNFWVVGSSRSTEFPNVDGWSTGEDFIVEFTATGGLSYSARYPIGTLAPTLGVDSAALLHLATPDGVASAIVPSPHPAVRPWTIGPVNGHVAAGEVISIYGPHLAGQVFIDDISGADSVYFRPADQCGGAVRGCRPNAERGFGLARVRSTARRCCRGTTDLHAGSESGRDSQLAGESAPVGTIMSVWVTGATTPYEGLRTGQIATGPQEYSVGTLFADGLSVDVRYYGAPRGSSPASGRSTSSCRMRSRSC